MNLTRKRAFETLRSAKGAMAQAVRTVPFPAYGFGRRLGRAGSKIAGNIFVLLAAMIVTALVAGLFLPDAGFGERFVLSAEGALLDVILAPFVIGAYVLVSMGWRGAVQAYDYIWHGLPVAPVWWRA
jgi:hypothetical protein